MAARPATRRTVERPQGAALRPAVRDFTGGTGFPIEWDVRPVYDFVFSLSDDAGSTDDLPAADRRWLTDARASLPQDLRESVSRFFGSELAIHIASFVVERPEIRTSAQFVAAVEAATPGEILSAVFVGAFHEPGLPEPLAALIAGDVKRMKEVEAKLPDWKREDRLAMLKDPDDRPPPTSSPSCGPGAKRSGPSRTGSRRCSSATTSSANPTARRSGDRISSSARPAGSAGWASPVSGA